MVHLLYKCFFEKWILKGTRHLNLQFYSGVPFVVIEQHTNSATHLGCMRIFQPFKEVCFDFTEIL